MNDVPATQRKTTAPRMFKEHLSAEETGWTTLSQFWGALNFNQMSLTEALRQVVFLACADVLAQDISKVSMQLRKKIPDGGNELVGHDDHWLARKLALEPNSEHTWDEYWFMQVFYLATTQNCYSVKRINRVGEVLDFIPLMSTSVTTRTYAKQSNRGIKRFFNVNRSSDYEQIMLEDFPIDIPDTDMIHTRGRLFDGLNGLSSLAMGNEALQTSKYIDSFMRKTYKNDASLRGVFQTDKTLETNTAFDRLRLQLREAMKLLNSENFPLILEDGLKFEGISMDMTEAEIAKAKDIAIEEQCRLMRVPPHKVMHMNAVKYENLATIERAYVRDSLVPIARRLEQKHLRASLSEKDRLEYYLEFDREAMYFADPEAQAKLNESYQKYGSMSVNEARRRRGANSVEWGNLHAIPVQISLFDGETGEFKTAAGADPSKGQDGDLNGDGDGKSQSGGLSVVEGGRK